MQRYHSSFISYIKGRSDFQVKGLERERERGGGERGRERKRKRERERERESTAADRNSFTIFFINAVKQKRPFYRCFG